MSISLKEYHQSVTIFDFGGVIYNMFEFKKVCGTFIEIYIEFDMAMLLSYLFFKSKDNCNRKFKQ